MNVLNSYILNCEFRIFLNNLVAGHPGRIISPKQAESRLP